MRTKPNGNLIAWLSDPRLDEFFGGSSFTLKTDVLAAVLKGNANLAALGRKHGVTRQAVHAIAKDARRIFGLGKAAV